MASIDSNNIITINRGDNFIFEFRINLGTNVNPIPYQLLSSDNLYLGVCEPNQIFEDAIIKKVFTSSAMSEDGIINIEFNATDTLYLLPGIYYYSIKLKQVDEETSKEKVITLLPKTKFIIIE